jgi:hypothetical protein
MRKLFTIISLMCALALGAQAQFLGYVGGQSTTTKALNAVTASGASGVMENVGQAAHYLTYCIAGGNANSVGIQIEGSEDGTTYNPISSQGNDTSGCAQLTAAGYFPAIRVNLVTFSAPGGVSLTAYYSGVAMPISQPPVQCPKTVIANIATQSTATNFLEVSHSGNTHIYVCGLDWSYAAAPSTSAFELVYGTGTNCGTGTQPIWNETTASTNPSRMISGIDLMIPIGQDLCISVSSGIGVTTTFNIPYAQF